MRAFSLIELILVVLIIATLSAIAIPRISRGVEGASEKALVRDLQTLRKAIDLYAIEHQGLFPDQDSTFVPQLTQYSDLDGAVSPVATVTHLYGPYLAAMPPLPVGENTGSTVVRDGGSPGDGSEGWFYYKNTGEIVANTKDDELDSSGVPFNQY